MRKFMNIFAAALVMLAAVSCEKNEVLPDNNSEGKVVTLKASINNGGTKTSLGPGVQEGSNPIQYPVYWSENDAIAVIQGSNVYEFILIDGDGTTSAIFQSESATGFDPSQPYNAFYPFSYVSKENSEIKYTIPTTQTYAENSFASGSVPMVATSSNLNDVLEFTSLSGALKLQLKGTKSIKSIEVVSTLNISGTIDSDPYNKALNTLEFNTSNCYKWVILDCGNEGVQLSDETEKNFIIAISKNSMYGGPFLTIIITDTEGNRRVVRTGLRQSITAENILKMPIVNYDPQENENEYIVVENGKETYYGAGVEVGGAVWAPVNCGYEPATSDGNKGFPRGKYYQWGRKDGYGYQSNSEASIYSTVISDGGHEDNPEPNTFYVQWDWTDESLKENGVWKEENNPCPEGWQVPSKQQMENLISKNSGIGSMGVYKDYRYGIYGTWFSGSNTYSDALKEKVFLERYGYVNTSVQNPTYNSYGAYWTSSNYYLQFGKNGSTSINPIIIPGRSPYNYAELRSCALNVRCVKSPNPIES